MSGRAEEALLRLAQWVDLGLVLVAGGAGIFFLVVWRRSAIPSRPAAVEERFIRGWRRTFIGSWVGAILASIPLLIRAGSPGAESLRLGLLVVGGIAWFAVTRSRSELISASFRETVGRSVAGNPDPGFLVPRVLAAMALLLLLLSAAITGHARTSSLPLPNLLVALVHVTAAAAWAGGLVTLVTMAFPSVRGQEEGDRARLLAPVIARFSDVAAWSVFAVVASGTYSAWAEIGDLRALTASTYGLVFLAKLGAFVPVLTLGAVNNRWTKPRLVRAAREDLSGSSSLLVLRRLVALEIVLVAVVLVLTVFLLSLPPPMSRVTVP
jgi:uncharacterized membrane protein